MNHVWDDGAVMRRTRLRSIRRDMEKLSRNLRATPPWRVRDMRERIIVQLAELLCDCEAASDDLGDDAFLEMRDVVQARRASLDNVLVP